MKSNNLRIDRLKAMLALEERRANVQAELDSLTAKLTDLKDALFDGSAKAPAAEKVRKTAPGRKAAPVARKAATGRGNTAKGSLREKVLAALEAAGSEGIYVKELAQAIGTKPVNIHSWFHSNIQRNPSIQKLTGGHYRLVGDSKKDAVKAAKTPKAAKATKVAKAPKTAKVAKAPKTASATKSGSKRGALSTQILSTLEDAGAAGMSVLDIAANLDAKYKNIYIWFATTGKKNPSIKKVATATYALNN